MRFLYFIFLFNASFFACNAINEPVFLETDNQPVCLRFINLTTQKACEWKIIDVPKRAKFYFFPAFYKSLEDCQDFSLEINDLKGSLEQAPATDFRYYSIKDDRKLLPKCSNQCHHLFGFAFMFPWFGLYTSNQLTPQERGEPDILGEDIPLPYTLKLPVYVKIEGFSATNHWLRLQFDTFEKAFQEKELKDSEHSKTFHLLGIFHINKTLPSLIYQASTTTHQDFSSKIFVGIIPEAEPPSGLWFTVSPTNASVMKSDPAIQRKSVKRH